MLHSFGDAVHHHPTKLNSAMLNDVAFVWPGLFDPFNDLRYGNESKSIYKMRAGIADRRDPGIMCGTLGKYRINDDEVQQ